MALPHQFPDPDRRDFLRAGLVAAAAFLRGSGLAASVLAPRTMHPEPRPGITGEKVATAEDLHGNDRLIPLFDGVRKIPHIVDGIRCSCGCAGIEGYYSLLTCYEGSGAMAMHCEVCQGSGRLVVRLHGEGKSLSDIREAIDNRGR